MWRNCLACCRDVLAKLPALETVEVRTREPPRRNAPPSKANNDINKAFEELNRARTRHKYGYRAVSGPTVAWKPVRHASALPLAFTNSQQSIYVRIEISHCLTPSLLPSLRLLQGWHSDCVELTPA